MPDVMTRTVCVLADVVRVTRSAVMRIVQTQERLTRELPPNTPQEPRCEVHGDTQRTEPYRIFSS